MARAYIASIRALAVAGMAWCVYLAATRPLGLDEAALWDHLIRPPLLPAFRAPDAWNGLLYALLAERVIGILRLSEFSLRAPALLSGAVCAYILWRSRRPVLALAYAAAAAAGWFSTAQSYGLALAFYFCALDRPRHAGWLFGLSMAAHPLSAVLAVTWWRIKDIERVVIPAAATAFILLIIPASQARRQTETDTRPDFYRERQRRNAARGGGFQPPAPERK